MTMRKKKELVSDPIELDHIPTDKKITRCVDVLGERFYSEAYYKNMAYEAIDGIRRDLYVMFPEHKESLKIYFDSYVSTME